jgi:transketolase
VSIAYAKQNVIIVGTDPGITAELNGGTHMSFEDIGVMRSIPTMQIYDVVDEIQFEQAIPQLLELEGPVYVRVPRKTRPVVFDEAYKFTLGKSDVLVEGTDISILASGTMVYEAKLAASLLKEEGINAEVISINMVKPLDKETILKSIKKTNRVVVCENHNIYGGVFSAVAELICQEYPVKCSAIGVNDVFGQVGKYDELLKAYEMTKEDIVRKVKEQIK